MGDPSGQLKSLEKSFMFENGPRTRNWPGEWTPVRTLLSKALGLYLEHQTLAALTQKSCLVLSWRPGRVFSSPLRLTQRSESENNAIHIEILEGKKREMGVTIGPISLFEAAVVGNVFALRVYPIKGHIEARCGVAAVLFNYTLRLFHKPLLCLRVPPIS